MMQYIFEHIGLAIDDRYRESTKSWLTLLRDLILWGMKTPKLAMDYGALGFWAALRLVSSTAEELCCWGHKIENVGDKLSKHLQPKAKEQLHDTMRAPNYQATLEEMEHFIRTFGDKYPKTRSRYLPSLIIQHLIGFTYA